MLTTDEFYTHVKSGTCRISFIGMSNGGKSYRSRILHDELGFLWYHVDEEIQKALQFSSNDEISSWLGYPSSPRYRERERAYLELEDKFTKEAAIQTHGKNLVFDTTGSVAQLQKETLDILKENTLVVHLDVGEDALAQLMERFFREPKPVAWGEFFTRQQNESEESALRRCYPTLLAERLKRYRALAHINVSAREMYDASGEKTLQCIADYLSHA